MIFPFRREDCIDVEVKASGMTKQMEKDLLIEMGYEDDEGCKKEEEKQEEEDSEEEIYENCIEQNFEDLETKIKDLQLQVENTMKEEFNVPVRETSQHNDNERFEKISMASRSEKEDNTEIEYKTTEATIVENVTGDKKNSEHTSCDISSKINFPDMQESVSNTENETAYVEDFLDTQSMWSISTTATIAPNVIRKRVKMTLQKRDRKSQPKKIIAKGEASAVTRTQRDNRDTIRESTGIWGWE